MSQSRALFQLVSASRRRRLVQLVFEQASWALCAALAALILLLIAGTQVMSWYWPLALALLALGIGFWRMRGRVPGLYEIAQELDRRLGLRDLISTAFHFSADRPRYQPEPSVLAVVTSRAEAQAAAVRPGMAFPWTRPAAFFPVVALAAVSLLLLGLRYGRLSTLALRAPLVHLEFDPFAALFSQKQLATAKQPLSYSQNPLDTDAPQSNAAELAAEQKLLTVNDPHQNGVGLANQAGEKQSGNSNEQTGALEEGDASQPGKPSAATSSKDSSQKGSEGNQARQPGSKDAQKNSLLDKMRDALANLMDKMSLSQPNGSPRNSDKKGDPSQKSGEATASRQQSKGEAAAQAEGEKSNEPSDAQAQKSSETDASQDLSNTPKTGIGRSDGKKDTELAEQLEAMGKLSEILGKRSANVQGEVTVEVTSTKQSLRTPYLNRNAAHGEGGGEIHRDEVPLHLQDYIQRYYEQVRRPAPVAPKKTGQ